MIHFHMLGMDFDDDDEFNPKMIFEILLKLNEKFQDIKMELNEHPTTYYRFHAQLQKEYRDYLNRLFAIKVNGNQIFYNLKMTVQNLLEE